VCGFCSVKPAALRVASRRKTVLWWSATRWLISDRLISASPTMNRCRTVNARSTDRVRYRERFSSFIL